MPPSPITSRPRLRFGRWVTFALAVLAAVSGLVLPGAPAAADRSEAPVADTVTAARQAAISVGGSHACAIGTDDALRCWGSNWSGQLGDGTTTGRNTPTAVVGMTSGVTAVSTSEGHTCALRDGDVWCWGSNWAGQLGDGTTTDSPVPVQVSGLPTSVISVAVGGSTSCALLDDASVACWGWNQLGQAGDGTTTNSAVPVPVVGLGDVAAITAGDIHMCALRSTGAVSCWGANFNGQLGDGTTTHSSIPVAVSGLAPGVTAISAGAEFTCVITAGADVSCWGRNIEGAFGDGTTTQSTTPVPGGPYPDDVVVLAAGGYHVCALLADGTVWCAGANWDGYLGDGTTTSRLTPVQATGVTGTVVALTAGSGNTCAVTDDTTVWCWGNNSSDTLALGGAAALNAPVPTAVSGLSSGVAAVSAGGWMSTQSGRESHTCAVTTAGALWCWGDNSVGQLGDGTLESRSTPVAVTGLPTTTATVSAGNMHTCAITTAGGLWCWGSNSRGQLGDGTTTSSAVPIAVPNMQSGVTAVSAGLDLTCAVMSGAVWCWGDNSKRELGTASPSQSSTPVQVALPFAAPAAQVTAGQDQACAIDATGVMACWGEDLAFAIPTADPNDAVPSAPVLTTVPGGASVSAVSLGLGIGCASTTSGAMCWGVNFVGQLGRASASPVMGDIDLGVATTPVVGVTSGDAHTCALVATGSVECWGTNGSRQLGDGNAFQYTATPVTVSGLTAVSVDAGSLHTCAVTVTGAAVCWGSNAHSEIGDGFLPRGTVPMQTLATMRVASASSSPTAPPPPPARPLPSPERTASTGRVDVAAELSSVVFDPGVEVVYIAASSSAADALAAGAAAGARPGPVLRVERSTIPAATALELRRLEPQRIVVVGGDAVVDTAVVRALGDYAPDVRRVAGADRYATAVAAAGVSHPDGAPLVFLVSGRTGVDAAAGAAAAGRNGAPLLFVDREAVPAVTAAELRRLAPEHVVVLGGVAAVSDAVLAEVDGLVGSVERVAGADRFATAVAVARRFWPAGAPVVYVGSGVDADGASGAIAAAVAQGAPVLLGRSDCAPVEVLGELRRLAPRRIVAVGAAGALGACS